MAVALLDINVLIALAWPNHEHHTRAQRWFSSHAEQGWATCPLTQCGFVRISSNPGIVAEAVTPAQAASLLQQMMNYPAHIFWPSDIRLVDATVVPLEKLIGYRQVTDAYLLGLSIAHGGRLATLDQRISALARNSKELAAIEVIAG
jgi:toxin-antitoxin system PIN domain toxin